MSTIKEEREQNTNLLDNEAGGKLNYLKANYSHKSLASPYDFKLINYIFQQGKIKPEGTILDLACGTGSFKPVFESHNLIFHGVDIDNEEPSNNIGRCDIANQTLPYRDNFFELIFFKMGIEHLTVNEISHCLMEARRVLKDNGRLIVITPDWKWTYKFFFEEYTQQTPFMTASLITALKMSNFNCCYCKTFIQLPIVWKFPLLRLVCNIASLLYPIAKHSNKFIKYSQERPILAIAEKSSSI